MRKFTWTPKNPTKKFRRQKNPLPSHFWDPAVNRVFVMDPKGHHGWGHHPWLGASPCLATKKWQNHILEVIFLTRKFFGNQYWKGEKKTRKNSVVYSSFWGEVYGIGFIGYPWLSSIFRGGGRFLRGHHLHLLSSS